MTQLAWSDLFAAPHDMTIYYHRQQTTGTSHVCAHIDEAGELHGGAAGGAQLWQRCGGWRRLGAQQHRHVDAAPPPLQRRHQDQAHALRCRQLGSTATMHSHLQPVCAAACVICF